MDPREKVRRAYNAMECLGVSAKNVKPALKRLLKLYDKNWQLIEEDNYRTLADAIFEYEDDEVYVLFIVNFVITLHFACFS